MPDLGGTQFSQLDLRKVERLTSHDVFSSFLAPFLPLLIGKFGLSMTLAGSLTVFFRLPSLVTPFFGVISDRVDLRQIAIWAPAFTAVTMSLLGVAPDYLTVCLLLLCAGTSAAIFHVLGPVPIISHHPAKSVFIP